MAETCSQQGHGASVHFAEQGAAVATRRGKREQARCAVLNDLWVTKACVCLAVLGQQGKEREACTSKRERHLCGQA